LTRVFLFPMK